MNSTNLTIKKKAVIYCRVSTKEQVEEGNSLTTQERICKEYAISNGYEVVVTYREQGESAKTADRTELQKLLLYCSNKKNGIRVVIIYKLDRLSRNTDDYSQLRLMLKRYGVEIKSTSEHFENTPVGRFMENTLANISQFDNDIRAERCSGGMKEAIREGRYVWKAPIGYDNVKLLGKATIAKNEVYAPLVLRAFELVASNTCSVEEVYRVMTKEGLTRNGKPLVNSYFREMLTNELYAGWVNKFGERHKGLFEPIVSEALFAQVQRVIKYKGKLHAPHITDHPDFPLRRFIVNENNLKLTGSWCSGRKQKYPYYRFGRSGGANYNRDEFEKAFMEYMDSYAIDKDHYQKLIRFIEDELVAREQLEQKEAVTINEQIKSISNLQSALIKKNVDGVISDTILKQQLDSIEIELMNANARLSKFSYRKLNIAEAIRYLEQYFISPSKIWFKSKPDTKLALQRFQFPLGCTFFNNTFETAKTRRFFNVKSALLHADSPRVDSSSNIGNNLESTNTPIQEHTEFDFSFWGDFCRDVSIVYDILKSEEQNPP